MPNIKTYELPAEQSKLTPSETGIEGMDRGAQAWAETGRVADSAAWRISEFGRQEGQAIGSGIEVIGKTAQNYIDNHQDFVNLNKLGTLYSGAMADMTQDAGAFASAHPGDHDAIEQYRQQAFDKIDQLGANANTKKEKEFAEREGFRLKQEVANRLVSNSSIAAGQQVTDNLHHTVGNAASLLDGTTHGLDAAISMTRDMFKSQLDASGMEGEKLAKAQEEMSKAEQALAIADGQKMVLNNPAALKKMLDDGTYLSRVVGGQPLRSYLSPGQQVELTKRAQEGVKSAITTQTAANKQRADNEMSDNYSKNMRDGTPSPGYFIELQRMAGEKDNFGNAVFNMAEVDRARAAGNAAMNEPAHVPSDPQVINAVRQGIWTPPGMPGHIGMDELNQMMIQNSKDHTLISAKDYSLYKDFIKDAAANPEKAANMAEFERYYMNAVQPFVLQSSGADINGVKSYSAQSSARAEQLRLQALPQFIRGLQQGRTPGEMLDPDSPKSIFPRKLIEQSQPTQDEQNAISAIGQARTPLKSLNQQNVEAVQARWKQYQLEKEFNQQQIGRVTRPVWAPPINQPNLQPHLSPESLQP